MSYAEPVTITLEGVSAQNLVFSDEDFICVEIISDDKIEITLVGIVNDAGEVQLIPDSGYIFITDSVTGVHAAIQVVG